MPPLKNPRHERFCQEYAVNPNATKAYESVYPDASYRTSNANGSRLLVNASIPKRISQICEEMGYGREEALKDLFTCARDKDKDTKLKALSLYFKINGDAIDNQINVMQSMNIEPETREQIIDALRNKNKSGTGMGTGTGTGTSETDKDADATRKP